MPDRAATPWIVVAGHRSIYCSCDGDCDGAATTVREGSAGMEALLYRYGVDVWLNGHEHDYERNYPTYKHARATAPSGGAPGGNASNPELIVEPAATVYIVTGCAGDSENHEPFTRAQPSYSAFRSNTYGYSRMCVAVNARWRLCLPISHDLSRALPRRTFYNATHMLWEQVQTDNGQPQTTGSVIDAYLHVQTSHGPFAA